MTNIMAAAALIASQIGTPLPAGAPVATVPVASAKAVATPGPRAAASGSVSGTGMLSGSGYMRCNAPQNGSGWMSGGINLSAQMPIYGPDGAYGTIPVSGYVFLNGSCRNGSGFVSGSAQVTGYGALYARDGRRAGTVRLNGTVFVNQYVSEFAWINQFTTVTGWFTEDPQN